MSDKTTLLRMKGSKESQPFESAHAKRLLDYPNTQWEEVADKEPSTKTTEKPKTTATTGAASA
jgi:hypothetical protein